MTGLKPGWAGDVLAFWFREITPEQWFKKSDAFDAEVRDRFLAIHEGVARLTDAACLTDAATALAAVIALDQFPRNMFRGTPRAFATDTRALAIATAAIERGYDATFPKDERSFFYLPFEHCEDKDTQARCVALVAALGDPDLLKWAEAHKAIIDRFGRFPHRNEILARASTPEEREFLTQPGSSF
ncbi:MAG TPA: DUF924 family protein [Hyphomicrobiaceae bacterium]|jgi:uncharacterized protein (DUF924 family)|nr:DUF924 family protein [Hyphomicrobiaceae bacterium]